MHRDGGAGDAGRGDQDVDAAVQRLGRGVGRSSDGVGVGDVQCDHMGGPHLGGGGRQRLGVQVPQHHLAALGDDAGGGGFA